MLSMFCPVIIGVGHALAPASRKSPSCRSDIESSLPLVPPCQVSIWPTFMQTENLVKQGFFGEYRSPCEHLKVCS